MENLNFLGGGYCEWQDICYEHFKQVQHDECNLNYESKRFYTVKTSIFNINLCKLVVFKLCVKLVSDDAF